MSRQVYRARQAEYSRDAEAYYGTRSAREADAASLCECGKRKDDHEPFFGPCPETGCHRFVPLKYTTQEGAV